MTEAEQELSRQEWAQRTREAQDRVALGIGDRADFFLTQLEKSKKWGLLALNGS